MDFIDEAKYELRRAFKKKGSDGSKFSGNIKRWAIELSVALVVGIFVGCITYGLLNKEDKSLKIKSEEAVAIQDEQTATSADAATDEETQAPEEDYSDVVITVVDPSGYAAAVSDWSADEVNAAVSERSSYLENNKYWTAVSEYWEKKGVTDVSRYCMYLFNTDSQVYSASDFEGLSKEVIHIAKNEIYARHGYSFKDATIYNYFMGQIWYTPTTLPADFSEETFTETEVKNLDLLNSLDTM